MGLGALAAVLSDEQETIEDVYEPYLLQCGYLQRTPKGRIVTKMAYDLLGMHPPAGADQALF